MKKIIERWPLLLGLLAAFVIGLWLGGGGSKVEDHKGHAHTAAAQVEEQIWTCSMHPQIRQPKAGKCPICFMDLVPAKSGETGRENPRQLTLSPHAVKLAQIRTAEVEQRVAAVEIPLVGKVEYDETRLGYITARFPGRIESLYVEFTGAAVKKGDRLVSLYSPELITAQQELLQALKASRRPGSGKSYVDSAREKLKLWGLTPGQVKEIEKRGKPARRLTIYSPLNGIVIHKEAAEGVYVKTGARIYTIADLSRVWVNLDAYETDLPWIRSGQNVTFETAAYPGEMFKGDIVFIDPLLDPKTRTVKLRLQVANPRYKLKPGLFVRAVVHAEVSVSGEKTLIPATAPLITGRRAVVYVAVPGKEGVFVGREILLGPKAGDYYIVHEGLSAGEEVVVNGAFKIDADLQIQARPSMMSPTGGQPAPAHHGHGESGTLNAPPAVKNSVNKSFLGVQGAIFQKRPLVAEGKKIPTSFKQEMDRIADVYFEIQHALSSDSLADARKGSKKLLEKLSAVDMTQLSGAHRNEWKQLAKTIKETGKKIIAAQDIEAARLQLEILTVPVTTVVKKFGSGKNVVYRFHCPMAFDNKGAFWLQNHKDTRNPYFGASMLLCKDKVETLVEKKK